MPHENKFSGQAHAENKLSVRTKFDSTPVLKINRSSSPYRLVVKLRSKGPNV